MQIPTFLGFDHVCRGTAKTSCKMGTSSPFPLHWVSQQALGKVPLTFSTGWRQHFSPSLLSKMAGPLYDLFYFLSSKIKPFEVDIQHGNWKHGCLKLWENYKQIGGQDLISWTGDGQRVGRTGVGQSFIIAGTTNPTSSNPHPEANHSQTPAWQHNSAHLHLCLASADAETEANWQQDNSGENYIFCIAFICDYI